MSNLLSYRNYGDEVSFVKVIENETMLSEPTEAGDFTVYKYWKASRKRGYDVGEKVEKGRFRNFGSGNIIFSIQLHIFSKK
ncbi:MAG: hypothetical protein K2N95_13570 [Lachnospiraceae bacterium]|nr:hypothetical protein [Lachnospiraceae bacterium]